MRMSWFAFFLKTGCGRVGVYSRLESVDKLGQEIINFYYILATLGNRFL